MDPDREFLEIGRPLWIDPVSSSKADGVCNDEIGKVLRFQEVESAMNFVSRSSSARQVSFELSVELARVAIEVAFAVRLDGALVGWNTVSRPYQMMNCALHGNGRDLRQVAAQRGEKQQTE